jgi:hypothetical protein
MGVVPDIENLLQACVEGYDMPLSDDFKWAYQLKLNLEPYDRAYAIRPSNAGHHPLAHQLGLAGYSKPEPLSFRSLMNLYRGISLESPLLAYLQSHLPGAEAQVRLESSVGLAGIADLVWEGYVIDVKCSMGQSWVQSPGYATQLALYSEAANGLTKPAYLINYNGELEIAVVSINRLKNAYAKTTGMLEWVRDYTTLESIISMDNPAYASLSETANPTYWWSYRSKGLYPYMPSLYDEEGQLRSTADTISLLLKGDSCA